MKEKKWHVIWDKTLGNPVLDSPMVLYPISVIFGVFFGAISGFSDHREALGFAIVGFILMWVVRDKLMRISVMLLFISILCTNFLKIFLG